MKTESPQLIGRREEQRVLEAVFQSKTAELIAVYGRRRVGKTFLIKRFFKNKEVIFFHVTGTKDAPMSEQLNDFTRIIESTFYRNQLEIKTPSNWKKAFELLTNIVLRESPQQKVILFFDELPWLAGRKSRFIQALDYYWNRFWSDMSQIKLIVCGSAASWMLDHVISHKGGLHNRITGQMALSPFDLKETKEYLHYKNIKYNDAQILMIYMALGGIPYYLNFLRKELSATQNIDYLCFQQKGILVEEFNRLYASLFTDPILYEELIRVIASKRRGIERSDLIKKSKHATDGGRLKERLNALEQSGFIISFKPYGFVKRKTFYQLIDEYSLFYLRWIEPALSTIKKLDKTNGYWAEQSLSPAWRAWSGFAFEAVCYKHLAHIRKALSIPPSAEVGSWQYIHKKGNNENGAQIDLLFDRQDDVITLCEIKYKNEPYALTKEEAKVIARKIEVFKKRTKTMKQIQFVLITNMPMKPTMYAEEMVSYNVTLRDLF